MEQIFNSLFINQTALQAVVVIFLIMAVGILAGKIKIAGIALGVTFVFFCGIFAGHIGLEINHEMLLFAQNFGLIIFVYALGLQVGPGFFNSFRKGGFKLNACGLAVILIDTLMAIGIVKMGNISMPDMMGILSGAVTNTPALAAGQEVLSQAGLPTASPALACAITYPLGVVGVIFAIIILRKVFAKKINRQRQEEGDDATYIAAFDAMNPAIIGRTIKEIAGMTSCKFVISRLWRDGKVIVPTSDTVVIQGDRLLVVTDKNRAKDLVVLFGCEENKDWNNSKINWNSVDGQLVSYKIVVTRPSVNGKTIESLKLRNRFGVNISRVYRAGMLILATPDLVLQMGDRLIVVGKGDAMSEVVDFLGNSVKDLREPNVASICIGIIIGLALGSIPVFIPGIGAPIKLGLAGGPVIAGILMGAFGPRIHMVTYTTESASLMLRKFGLSMYLACLGLDSGKQFFATVFRPEGLEWIAIGLAITMIPVLLIGGFMLLGKRNMNFPTLCGVICGCMANPMALTYASDTLTSSKPAVAYTTVYPLAMFTRVIIAQILILMFI